LARRFLYTSSESLFVIVFAAILIIVYLIASNHNISLDLSRTGINTLDSKTKKIIQSLGFDVLITVFDKEGAEKNLAQEVLDLYVDESERLSYTIIDPDVRPAMASEYGVDRYGQAVLTGRNRQVLIDRVTEEDMTNALVKLKRDKKKVVYFITGHGERDFLNDQNKGLAQLADALKKDDYEVRRLLLMREQAIPQDADLIAAIDPKKRFLPEELEISQRYLDAGGSMLLALEPGTDAGLRRLLWEYGMDLDDGIIIDTFSTMVGGDYTVPVVTTYGDVKPLRDFAYATFFPTSRALIIRNEPAENTEVVWLARTSEKSWSEDDYAMLFDEGSVSCDESEIQGPLNVALLAGKKNDNEMKANLVVFGDADFISNAYLNVSGNKDLALGCINMLLHEGHLITLDKKIFHDRPFILTPAQSAIFFWVPVVVIPAVILLCALCVFWRMRRA
jgi:ABC-type uncharacterized transport system involved in gliding motility auxiliary subunit